MSETPQGEGWWQASDLKWYPPADQPGGSRRRWVLPAGLLVVVALIAGVATFLIASRDDEAEALVLLEPVASAGPDPFTESVSITEVAEFPDSVNAVITETVGELPPDETTGTLVAVGDTPGLYGGTGDDAACNVPGLDRFLTDPANSDKAAAWAGAFGIGEEQISDTLESLTSTVLTADTRVTNNGFADGRATPRQSVLQAGSAVLVDDLGVPRVRCSCGNPLSTPEGVDLSAVPTEGAAWSAYSTELVTTPAPAPEALESVTLLNIDDAELYEQQTGSPLGTRWVATAGSDDGRSGTIHTSDDGAEWVRTASTDVALRGVAQGDGLLVAVGGDEDRGIALSSTDGSSWSEPIEVGDQPLLDVAYGSGLWVALASDRAYTSEDGSTWSQQPAIRFNSESDSAGSLAFGEGRFSVVTATCGASRCFSDDVLTSPDGISWTRSPVAEPNPDSNGAPAIAFNGRFGVVGDEWDEVGANQSMAEQTTTPFAAELVDGRWGEVPIAPDGTRLRSLSATLGTWYAVGTAGSASSAADTVYSSTDLSEWSEIGTVDAELTDVVVAAVLADTPAPTEQAATTTTVAESSSGEADVVLTTESVEVLDPDGDTEVFDNGGAVGPLVSALTDTLGPVESTRSDDGVECGVPSTTLIWGQFSLTYYGTAPANAEGFRASLEGRDDRIATVESITVGTPIADVLAAFPDAATSDVAGGTRVLLDPDPSGEFGVVVQGTDSVEEIYAPYVLDQLDDC